jgi:plasmid stabilization system protein ParE
MTMRLEHLTLAKLDVAEIVDYLSARRVSSAERFLECLEESYEFLRDYPECGAAMEFDNPRLNDIRVWPVSDFRTYLIFSRVQRKLFR